MYSEVEKQFDRAVIDYCKNLQNGTEIAKKITSGEDTPKRKCIEKLCQEVTRYERITRAAHQLTGRDQIIKTVVEMHVKAIMDLTDVKVSSEIARRKKAEEENAKLQAQTLAKEILREVDPETGEAHTIE